MPEPKKLSKEDSETLKQLSEGKITFSEAIFELDFDTHYDLLDLMADAFKDDKKLSALSDYVDDSGEGRWTVQDSIDLGVPTPVLTLALQMRFRSRQDDAFAGKVLNAMRAGFGGHSIRSTE